MKKLLVLVGVVALSVNVVLAGPGDKEKAKELAKAALAAVKAKSVQGAVVAAVATPVVPVRLPLVTPKPAAEVMPLSTPPSPKDHPAPQGGLPERKPRDGDLNAKEAGEYLAALDLAVDMGLLDKFGQKVPQLDKKPVGIRGGFGRLAKKS